MLLLTIKFKREISTETPLLKSPQSIRLLVDSLLIHYDCNINFNWYQSY